MYLAFRVVLLGFSLMTLSAIDFNMQAGSIVGNETAVEAGRTVEAGYNLQGDLLFPGGIDIPNVTMDVEKGGPVQAADLARATEQTNPSQAPPRFDIFAPGVPSGGPLHVAQVFWKSCEIVLLFLIFETVGLVVCWAPPSLSFSALYHYLRWQLHWNLAACIFSCVALVFPAVVMGMLLSSLWVQIQVLVLRGRALWAKETVSVGALRPRLLSELKGP